MFSHKRTIFAVATAAFSLALFAGCGTYEAKPKAEPPATASIIQTNQPAPPKVKLPPDSGDNLAPNILAWDAVAKEYHAKSGELLAPFTFSVTNVSSGPIMIYDTSTTCDCTVAKLPSKPWTLPSGGTGEIHATIDLSKKTGVVTNQIIVFTSLGNRRLAVKAFASDSK